MTKTELLRQLKAFGTEQNRKVYARHGVADKMYGVSYANLAKLKKQIKADHDLAVKLWDSGNHDARILATMIADPAEMKSQQLDVWAKELGNYVITDAFASLAGKTKYARKKMEKWTRSKQEWTGRLGWLLLVNFAQADGELTNAELTEYRKIIEAGIHTSTNRVKDAMNSALMAMGIYRKSLQKKAIATARRIGKIDVDHGETNCKTPAAESYIKKAVERQKASASK